DVASHHAPGADHAARADAHSGVHDRAAAYPYIRPYLHRLAELLSPARLRVERMHGRVDLHGRTEHRVLADAHRAYVEHDAVEVEEDPLAQLDVRAVVAVERRLHPHCL